MQRTVSKGWRRQLRLWFGLFLPWLVGTALAAAIGWFAVLQILLTTGASAWDLYGRGHQVALWGGMGIIYGTLVGAAQWVTLQYWLDHAWRWIVATALGECVYWILSFTSGSNLQSMGRGSLIGACAGLALGSAQWVVLRRDLRHAWAWILVTVAGAVLGEVATQSLPSGGHPSLQFAIGPMLTSAVIGLATAIVAVMLFSGGPLKGRHESAAV